MGSTARVYCRPWSRCGNQPLPHWLREATEYYSHHSLHRLRLRSHSQLEQVRDKGYLRCVQGWQQRSAAAVVPGQLGVSCHSLAQRAAEDRGKCQPVERRQRLAGWWG